MENENSTVLKEFSNRTQADIAVNLLKSFGINAWIEADDLGGIGPAQSFVQGVEIYVETGDLQSALQILETPESPDDVR
jgi:5-enolpyruvylshikimate-3-phosphate synthase